MFSSTIKILSLPIIALFGYSLWQNNINVPNADDFTLLQFALNYKNSHDFTQLLELIFAKHNEHIIALSRIATLCSVFLFSYIDFAFLVILGNLALLATLYLISSEDKKNFAIPFFILCATLLQPQHAQATLWTTSSLAMMFSTFFSVASFSLASRDKTSASLAAFFTCSLALLSQGNGAFSFLICAALFAARKRFIPALLFSLSFLATIWALYLNNLGEASTRGITDVASYLLKFLGSALSFGNSTVALIAGSILLLLSLYLALSGRSLKTSPVLWGVLAFCVMTAAANALSRSDLDLGANSARYRFISALLLGTVLIHLSATTNFKKTILCFTGLFFTASQLLYYHYPISIGQMLQDSLARWQISQSGSLHPDRNYSDALLKEAIAQGLYRPPLLQQIPESSLIELPLPHYTRTIVKGFDHLLQSETHLLLDGWVAVPKVRTNNPQIYLVLQNDLGRYVFTTEPRYRPDVTSYFKGGYYDESGFFALVPKSALPKGEYLRGILIEQDGVSTLRYFSPEVTIN